jgi:hypothetical protein
MAALIAGCSASATVDNPFSAAPAEHERARLAAFAASSEYPTTRPSDTLRATALIDREAGTIQILNPTDRALHNSRVWVNGSFVARVDEIPPQGSVTINRARFYSPRGNTLQGMNTSATRVQIETDGELYNLQGPVFE